MSNAEGSTKGGPIEAAVSAVSSLVCDIEGSSSNAWVG